MQQETLEEQVIQRYQNNIAFIEKNDPRLFRKLQAFESALENNLYEEKYVLEYKDEGYFDVLEKESGNYLYGANSNEYAKQVANAVDLSKTDNLFETFYNLSFEKVDPKDLETKDIIKYSYSTVASLINYSNEHAAKTKTTMKKLYKFIFVGTGLGTHITTLHEKLHSNVYLIIEDDLELFRLSLFVTDYAALTKEGAKIFFSIFDEPSEFKNMVQAFLYEQFIYNHYIKFFHMLHHDEKPIKEIQNIIVTQTYLTFNYAALMTSLLRPLEYLKNGYKILNIATSYEDTPLAEKPVLIIGAGPSFDKNIHWLKENHQNFIIVIVSALMSKFEELGIKPDIITHVHGFEDAMPHIEKVKDMHFFDETIELFGGMSYPDFTTKFLQKNVYIIEGSSRYKRGFSGITSSNIGSLSYGLLLYLGAKEIYLLGLDFAMDKKTGQTHSRTHSHTRQVDLHINDEIGGGILAKDEIIEIKGNFEDKVYTSVLLDSMRRECNAVSKTYKNSTTHSYNLSDGAYIDDTIPRKPQEISRLQPIDKQQLYRELHEAFDKRSENFLTQEEFQDIQKRLEYYDSVIAILEKHLTLTHENLDHYHYNLLGTFYNILADDSGDTHTSDLNYIITLYLQFVSGYIFDLINTAEIEDTKQLTEQLDEVIIPQIIRVIKYFRDTMQEIVEGIEVR